MEKELFDFVAERADVLATADTSKQETKDGRARMEERRRRRGRRGRRGGHGCVHRLPRGQARTPSTGSSPSPQGPAVELFGKEAADQILAEQTARKERGEKYCDCAACTAAVELLSKFGRI